MRSRSENVGTVADLSSGIDAAALIRTSQIIAGNFDALDPALVGERYGGAEHALSVQRGSFWARHLDTLRRMY